MRVVYRRENLMKQKCTECGSLESKFQGNPMIAQGIEVLCSIECCEKSGSKFFKKLKAEIKEAPILTKNSRKSRTSAVG